MEWAAALYIRFVANSDASVGLALAGVAFGA
jgi:hypothetical protein